MTKVDRTEIDAQIAASIKKFSMLAKGESARAYTNIDMPHFIRKKAAMISAHFLLPAGSRVLDLSCGTGEVTYAMAQINPRLGIIGLDQDASKVEFARKTYRLPNLTFRQYDINALEIEDETIDGIINSNVLHQVYSAAGYDTDGVRELLERQVRKLKVGGTMLIRDHVLPSSTSELVLLELPNVPSQGNDPSLLSDADLLVRFSQTARPMVNGCEGFFIEEIMPRREGTRLFRLPHKWALEFIHRKDSRQKWEDEIHEEYTFYSQNDFRRQFAKLGMRMVYSAPYWNPWVVKNCFKGRFQLYRENDTPMPYPATNYFIVAQKVADRQSLALEERRPSQKPVSDLQIMTVRDKKTGALHELVKRPGEYCDVVPYRITPDNRLVMYVRSGYPRPIINAVARGCNNLDGKKWSGHLVEPITMSTGAMTDSFDANREKVFGHVRGYAGLAPKSEKSWRVGEAYFPSPDRIDEAIEPVFVEVENPQKSSWPIVEDKDIAFSEPGMILEIDSKDIVHAAQIGLLPEPRLEMYAFELMAQYNITLPEWLGEGMPPLPVRNVEAEEPEDLLKAVEKTEFEDEKRGAIHLRAVKSVFVEEGKVGKSTRGLSAQDVEFVVTDDGVENVAVVLPMTIDWNDNLLVALEPKIMPVPNRMGGDGAMLNAPSFILPADVKSIDDAKTFIADKFRIPLENVVQMGESYFTHTGVTPQRIYPFAIAAPEGVTKEWPLRFMMVKRLWKLYMGPSFRRQSQETLKVMMRMQTLMDDGHDMRANAAYSYSQYGDFQLATDKEVVAGDKQLSSLPSRILGQRGNGPDAGAENAAELPALEAVAPARPRLMEHYAEAKKFMRTDVEMNVSETPAVAQIDREITEVGGQLKKAELVADPARKIIPDAAQKTPAAEPPQKNLFDMLQKTIADPTAKGRR